MDVILAEPLGRGGIAHYTHCLATALTDMGVAVEVATADDYEMADDATYRVNEIFPVRRRSANLPPGARQFAKLTAMVTGMRALARRAEREKPRIVHWQASLVWADWLFAHNFTGGSRAASPKIVWTAHNILPHERRRFHGPVYRRAYTQVDSLIVHAADNLAALDSFAPDHADTSIVRHGDYGFFGADVVIDQASARAELGLRPQDKVVLFFGTIRGYKGLDDLIEAARVLKGRVGDFRLVIAGSPVESFSPYRRSIANSGLTDQVVVACRYIPNADVAKYFLAADVVALPYKNTYHSGVAHTALAFGVPVVASDVGGLRELITDSGCGLLVPPGNIKQLSEGLHDLLTDSEKARRLGENGRRYGRQEASWSTIAKETLEIYGLTVGDGELVGATETGKHL